METIILTEMQFVWLLVLVVHALGCSLMGMLMIAVQPTKEFPFKSWLVILFWELFVLLALIYSCLLPVFDFVNKFTKNG